ncbi:uncharacterized protein LOC143878808 [Tasmannia lanceolata]|uniref:uncharacterized protein LOC143878808 n=1 Tax=Tasmannia lanceolata TaxID=3420 RepID=UPI004064B574
MRVHVKGIVKNLNPELICIQETKLEVIDRYIMNSLGVRLEWGFSFVRAIGASGGILIAWDESKWVLVEEWKGRFSISIVLRMVDDASLLLFSGVYGPSLWANKRLLWEELNRAWGRWPYLWFSWNRADSHGRINHFLICPGWMNLAPEVYQKAIIHSVSDHCPLLLDPRLESWGPPPFRFEIAWLQIPHMGSRLRDWWESLLVEGPADVVIGKKLRYVKKKLKEWVSERRLVDLKRNVWLENRIEEITRLEESDLGDINLREELGRVKEEHRRVVLHEEISWRQKLRVKWLKEMDKNTAYFHAMASARRRRNRIESLMNNGVRVSGKEEVTKVIQNFYTSMYSSEGSTRPLPEGLVFSELSLSQQMALEYPFDEEEIRKGFFPCVVIRPLVPMVSVLLSFSRVGSS